MLPDDEIPSQHNPIMEGATYPNMPPLLHTPDADSMLAECAGDPRRAAVCVQWEYNYLLQRLCSPAIPMPLTMEAQCPVQDEDAMAPGLPNADWFNTPQHDMISAGTSDYYFTHPWKAVVKDKKGQMYPKNQNDA